MNLPISLTVQTLAKAMKANPGQRSRFHIMVEAAMGQIEGTVNVPTDYVLVADHSGSMGGPLEGGEGSILDNVQRAAEGVINSLQPRDRVAIVQFDDSCQTLLPLTSCDPAGKINAVNTIYAIGLGGMTNFQPALADALSMFDQDPGRKRTILFFTDGANSSRMPDNSPTPDPLPTTGQIAEAGISLFIGGLGVNNAGEQLLEQMAGVNFKSLDSAQDVANFFASSQAQAELAMVTNARLIVSPVNFVTTTDFELVTRGDELNYVKADKGGICVPFGDISVGDKLQSYLGLQLQLPDDIKPSRRAFGKIELIGDVPSQGLTGDVLAKTFIAVQFSEQVVPGVNETVKDMMHLAATAREVAAAAQSGDATEMKQHLEEARKTIAFSAADAAAALKRQMDQIQEAVDSDPEAARKQARRATKAFSAEEAAAALKNMG